MNRLKKLFNFIKYYYLTLELIRFKKNYSNEMDECVVLGNGPSLSASLRHGFDFFKNKKIMCVNNFAETDYYTQIKPNFYVLADPIFWEKKYEYYSNNYNNDEKKIRGEYFDALKNIRSGLIDSLLEKTQWELNLFVPIHSKSSKVFENISIINSNIKVIYYSTIPINTRISCIRHFFYKINIGMPTPQNVLIPAIFLALKCKFKFIYLMGADHSWHQELVLDRNNILGTYDRHFYDETENKKIIPLMWDIESGKTTKVHEQFYALYLVFRSHLFLECYSKNLKAKIFNMSKVTWIDAYARDFLHKSAQ